MAQFHKLSDSIQSGTRLSFPDADAQNAMLEAGRWVRGHREDLNRIVAPKGFERHLSLWGENNTGQVLDLFNIVKLDNVLFDHATNENEFLFRTSISLTMPDPDAPAGIVASSAYSGAIIEVKVMGVSPVQINVSSASHTNATVILNDPAKLQSGSTGPFEILWKESGTGLKWALVRFPVGGAGTVVKWAAMDGRWWHGTDTDYCFAHPCDDWSGAGEDPDTDLFIWLPKQGVTVYAPPNGMLPNLKAEQVIPYTTTSDGLLVIAQDYTDSFKGACQIMVRDAAVEGWAKMDGVANSTGNGGSGITWTTGYFFKETKTGAQIGTVGKTEPALPDHAHQICATGTDPLATDPNGMWRAVAFNVGWKSCTRGGGMILPVNDCATCNEPPFTPTLYAEPNWVMAYLYERIDNSGNPDLVAPPHVGHP